MSAPLPKRLLEQVIAAIPTNDSAPLQGTIASDRSEILGMKRVDGDQSIIRASTATPTKRAKVSDYRLPPRSQSKTSLFGSFRTNTLDADDKNTSVFFITFHKPVEPTKPPADPQPPTFLDVTQAEMGSAVLKMADHVLPAPKPNPNIAPEDADRLQAFLSEISQDGVDRLGLERGEFVNAINRILDGIGQRIRLEDGTLCRLHLAKSNARGTIQFRGQDGNPRSSLGKERGITVVPLPQNIRAQELRAMPRAAPAPRLRSKIDAPPALSDDSPEAAVAAVVQAVKGIVEKYPDQRDRLTESLRPLGVGDRIEEYALINEAAKLSKIPESTIRQMIAYKRLAPRALASERPLVHLKSLEAARLGH